MVNSGLTPTSVVGPCPPEFWAEARMTFWAKARIKNRPAGIVTDMARPPHARESVLDAFERLDLTADEKAKIRSGNAMKLFGR